MKPFLSFTSVHSLSTDPGSSKIRDVLTMDEAAVSLRGVLRRKLSSRISFSFWFNEVRDSLLQSRAAACSERWGEGTQGEHALSLQESPRSSQGKAGLGGG